ncbi:type II toxin-antitoxin system prevent-host-death family antitoxin [Kitasatospora sp. NPDC059646]|uniref:type II toxin-antitoxin system prevent-host-death family antitoxin n=1 Tax=Kitasatospora sp. NPDC059646 TaxID=3346893 RepID=UPI0036B1F370
MTADPQGRPELPANVPTVALADARAELSRIVTLAEHTGRVTAITRYGRPVAAVVPAALLHLLAPAHLGPRPMEATDLERIAERARSAELRPSSDQIDEALQDIRAGADSEDPVPGTTPLESRLEELLEIFRAAPHKAQAASDLVWALSPVRVVLAEHGAAAPEQLAALPEDLTMADLLEAWAEKQQGGSR